MHFKFGKVAQLSLTNPHDVLHYCKILKQGHVTITTPLLWVICHPVAKTYIAYLCTKFDNFGFSRSSDMIGAPKFFTWDFHTVLYQLTKFQLT